MTETQLRIMNLLKEVDSICRENDIEYYLEGGAILGAIRHGGFLPWDDDTDITMTRKNWDKFREVFERTAPKNRALESPEINHQYPTNTVRYIDTTTTNIWRSLMFDVCACGSAVDIFILEDAPDDDEKLEQMKQDFIDYCEIINPYYRLSSLGDGKRYKKYLRRSRLVGRNRVMDELNKKIRQFDGLPSHRYLMRWGMRFQVYDKSVFGNPTYVPFEDMMLPIPENPIEYLIYQYGIDWHMIPEENAVELHDTIVDFEIGYREYMKAYIPLINKKAAMRNNFKYKNLEMEILDYNKAFHWHIYGTAGRAAAFLLHKKIDSMNIDLNRAFSGVTDEANLLFEELFSDYLNKQLHQWYIFYGVFVPIDDNLLSIIIGYLLRCGRCREAEKLIIIRQEQKKDISKELRTVIDSYEMFVKATCLFWSNRREEAATLLEKESEYIIPPTGNAFRLLCEIEKSSEKSLLEQMKAKLENNIQCYPQEDLFKLAYIKVLIKLSENEKAALIINELSENSRNGMVLQTMRMDAEMSTLMHSDS